MKNIKFRLFFITLTCFNFYCNAGWNSNLKGYQIDSLYYCDNIDSSLILALKQKDIIETDSNIRINATKYSYLGIRKINFNQIIRAYSAKNDCDNAYKFLKDYLSLFDGYVYCAINFGYTNLHTCYYWQTIRDSAEALLKRDNKLNPKLLFNLLAINDKTNFNMNFLATNWKNMDSITYLNFCDLLEGKNKKIKKETANDLDSVINLYGYPTIKNAGFDAPYIAFNIIHHSKTEILLKYQKEIAFSYKEGSIGGEEYAKYVDRVLVATNCPQRYGTQFWIDDETKQQYYYPVENLEQINTRRSELGLQPVIIPINNEFTNDFTYKAPKEKY